MAVFWRGWLLIGRAVMTVKVGNGRAVHRTTPRDTGHWTRDTEQRDMEYGILGLHDGVNEHGAFRRAISATLRR